MRHGLDELGIAESLVGKTRDRRYRPSDFGRS
jgi:hypothetical protein